ncbi:MAG: hypothetical protein GF334_04090 [Candidatus Altiarchaeales archaeon]|nr:hypothetical protein [Candidatus Altiarchaeales archaeon]
MKTNIDCDYLGAEKWVETKLDLLNWFDEKTPAINNVGRDYSKAYQTIESHYMVLERMLFEILWRSDCEIACGLCCFFPDDESVMVPVEKNRLKGLRDSLRSQNKKPEDYVKLRMLSELHPQIRPKISAPKKTGDFITQHGGLDMIYFLRTKPVFPLDKSRLKEAPLLRGGSKNWLDEGCRQCVFLEDDACTVYDTDFIPGSCKNFMCFTGFIINILGLWGFISRKDKGKPLKVLNKAAFEADLVFASPRFKELEEQRQLVFKNLVESYLKGFGVAESHKAFEDYEQKYFIDRKKLFKPALSLLNTQPR